MINIIIINGPNLNLLGRREKEIYGSVSFEAFFKTLESQFPDISLTFFQSNHEGELIDKLQEVGFSYEGIILNAAGYTHTSIALMDTVKAITTPVVEVHISDIEAREAFRKFSYISLAAAHIIKGKGLIGYKEGVEWLLENYKN